MLTHCGRLLSGTCSQYAPHQRVRLSIPNSSYTGDVEADGSCELEEFSKPGGSAGIPTMLGVSIVNGN